MANSSLRIILRWVKEPASNKTCSNCGELIFLSHHFSLVMEHGKEVEHLNKFLCPDCNNDPDIDTWKWEAGQPPSHKGR